MVVTGGDAVLEVVEVVELPVSVEVADVEVGELEELVVGADGQHVVAQRPGQVVGDLEDVLVQAVGARVLLGARRQAVAAGDGHVDLGEERRRGSRACRGWWCS